jgi:SAM domain (Sterile alpha motif)
LLKPPSRIENFFQVVDFVAGLAGCASVKEIFRSQAIDGQAFLLLKSEHLTALGVKMGPGNTKGSVCKAWVSARGGAN